MRWAGLYHHSACHLSIPVFEFGTEAPKPSSIMSQTDGLKKLRLHLRPHFPGIVHFEYHVTVVLNPWETTLRDLDNNRVDFTRQRQIGLFLCG